MARTPPSPVAGLPATVVDGPGIPVVFVHGFSQTRTSWRPLLVHLEGRALILPDLPGHGAAGHDEANLAESATWLAQTGGRAVYVGYSMGGRVALRLALDHPGVVAGLVLIGATAGIDDHEARMQRRRSDEALAERIERDGTRRFLESWLAQPLFASLTVGPDELERRRANRPAGLAASLRCAGTGTMDPPWWDELARISCPTLVVSGEHDQKFTEIAHRLTDAIGPSARRSVVADAGHAAHLERPAAVGARIEEFLSGLTDLHP